MHSSKSWRPIVTVEVDKHVCHETTLGVDGQNPNLKNGLTCSEARHTALADIKVWFNTQSKRKGKRRQLVASATHTLGELMQKAKLSESKARIAEVRLACQSTLSSKGRPQNGATISLKVSGPSNPTTPSSGTTCSPIVTITELPSYPSANTSSLASESEQESLPGSTLIAELDTSLLSAPLDSGSPASTLRRRRKKATKKRRKGYVLVSDEEHHWNEQYSSCDESLVSTGATSRCSSRASEYRFKDTTKIFDDPVRDTPLDCPFASYSDGEGGLPTALPDGVISVASNPVTRWLAASLLPQHILEPSKPMVPPYTETVEVYEPLDGRIKWWEKAISSFTMYLELRDARTDSEFESIFQRLRMEWTFIGTLLAGLAAVNTAVLSISPDATITLAEIALRAIASSSMFTGLGIASTAYFVLRYSFSPLSLFRTRALDVYGTYIFFSISARVPTLCMVASALSLMGFLGLVAFELWPRGVVVVSFMVGVILSLQFLVYGCHQVGRGVVGGSRSLAKVSKGVVRRLTAVGSVGPVAAVPEAGPSVQKATQMTAGRP
ncbi:hypothetical protein BKA70DRAFT_557266 [Coprinopsis sp. MPI-PUGE-AT-0042]|nr:hypothetical protein BKA70DRAFT_557266 [Coprinopsis sp. MPI-PUGE-AT-0042]